jgi:hypothetical protein
MPWPIEQGVRALLAVPAENLLTEMEITNQWRRLAMIDRDHGQLGPPAVVSGLRILIS